MNYKYIVVGLGFSGAVIAERLSTVLNEKVLVIDKRGEIGGNANTYIDEETGIEIHKYGSHIFHTNLEDVWKYINAFSSFNTYQHQVILKTYGRTTCIPINLKTINDIYSTDFTPESAKLAIAQEIKDSRILNPYNLEEYAISLIGKKLYENCIKGYTTKQWNTDPKLLPQKIITRLPVRFNYNSNYFNDKYQGIPTQGYTKLISNMVSSKNIEVRLNTAFNNIKEEIKEDTQIFYSGMIDEFFNYRFGALEWRSLKFEYQRVNINDYQGNSVINYNDIEIPYTRVHEFKHYHPEKDQILNIEKTVICYEYPKDWKIGDDAYYPIESDSNLSLLKKYQEYAKINTPNIIFIGRLGQYKYFDMDKAIKNSLDIFQKIFNKN